MAVASPYHQKIKFPVGQLVGEIMGEQKAPRSCYVEMVRADQKRAQPESQKGKAMALCEVHVLEESAP